MADAIHLTVSGTPFGAFERVFNEFLVGVLTLADPTLKWTFGDGPLQRSDGSLYWLVLIDRPAQALARALVEDASEPPDDIERAWCEGAARLCDALKAWQGPCLVLRSADVADDPAGAANVVARWCGLAGSGSRPWAPKSVGGSPGDPDSSERRARELAAGLLVSGRQATLLAYQALDVWVEYPVLDSSAPDPAPTAWTDAVRVSCGRAIVDDLRAAHWRWQRALEVADLVRTQLLAVHDAIAQPLQRIAVSPGPLASASQAAGAVRIDLGAVREEPAMRKLPITLHGLSVQTRTFERAEIRLVTEGHRAGIMLLATRATPAVLADWRPNGRTGSTSYVLLKTDDPESNATLASLSSVDWRILRTLTEQVARRLLDVDGKPHAWLDTALALVAWLSHQPPQLRHGPLVVTRHERGIELGVPDATAGDREFGYLRLAWPPDPEGLGEPVLSRDVASGLLPPLLLWPRDASGAWAADCPSPLQLRSWKADWRAWRRLPSEDRLVWLALFERCAGVLVLEASKAGGSLSGAHPHAAFLRRSARRASLISALGGLLQSLRELRAGFGRQIAPVTSDRVRP